MLALLIVLLDAMIGFLEQENAKVEDLLAQLVADTKGSEFAVFANDIIELVEDVEYASALKEISTLKSKLC